VVGTEQRHVSVGDGHGHGHAPSWVDGSWHGQDYQNEQFHFLLVKSNLVPSNLVDGKNFEGLTTKEVPKRVVVRIGGVVVQPWRSKPVVLGTRDGRGALLAVVDPLVPRVVLVTGRT
jgi:hypothetical protein